ncbi:two-component system activity regulator YycH [Aciduricibacillus chroicocephali]|uniref:Two-component system activity regulator YycH n=1 Tax=Aciduricibacillus chroicocephali TaxID=3054939 RepID=A0ABY9KUT7_9BACI|nr:two-component system activity regulator YycH [Bacillaceae bacterium 44XB]
MKMETFKSIALFFLVVVSLLLTLSLWNESPRYKERLYSSSYVNEVDVGGKEYKKKDIIDPNQVLFHNRDSVKGFEFPKDEKEFYIEMSFWSLHDFSTGEAEWNRKKRNEIEVRYPTPVPMKLLSSLFTMDDEVFLPAWSFNRAFITFNQASTAMQIKFLSADGAYEATATINDTVQYKRLMSYFETGNDLIDYIPFGDGPAPIYIPKGEQTVLQRSMGAQMIDEKKFVNALFKKPSMVSKNTGEAYYLDGQRGMRILQNKRSMEYINPIESNKVSMDPADLIDKSATNINEHKGWTADYNLFQVDPKTNTVRYKMYYKGYEVFNNNGLATIEQIWRNDQLYKYRRPLFSLNNSLGGDPITLPSGQELIRALKENSDYDLSGIQDIRIGYHLEYPESDAHSVILRPSWFMDYKGNWQEIKINKLRNEEGAA